MATSTPSPSAPAAHPAEICGYAVDRPLPNGTEQPSYLAIGPGGRAVVLKPLEDECLWKQGLHPSIRERLSRVRELALANVANLRGVERDRAAKAGHPGGAWLVWDYLPGRTFLDYATAPGRTPRQVALAARELILTTEALHGQGLVHGAIKPGNVIVDPAGGVRLTHVSPLLYEDTAEDARAVVAVLQESVLRRKEGRSPLGKLLAEAEAGDAPLRVVGTRLSALTGLRETSGLRPETPRRETAPRRRSLAGAAIVTLLGAAAAYGAWHVAGQPPIPVPKSVQEYLPSGWRR